MRSSLWLHVLGCLSAILLVAALPGCEKGPDTDEVSSYNYLEPNDWDLFTRTPLSNLKLGLDPSTATVSYDGGVLPLQAVGGTAPFTWSVSDISLGAIVETSGRSAVYRRNAAGDNIIIVRDRNGREAYCTVSQ